MFRAVYQGDRVEQVPPGTGIVADKIQGIFERSPVGYKQLPFISESGYLPPRVLRSVMARHYSLWGRY